MKFPRYPGYKDSGIAWLGEVPAQWEVARIKSSVASCRNGIWGREETGDGDDIPCVRVADFDRNRLVVDQVPPTIRGVSVREREGRLLSSGNLLLEKSGGGEGQPVGCVVLYDCDAFAVCSNFVARMELRLGMVPSFWRYVHAAAYAVRLTTRSINQTSGIQNLDQDRYFNELVAFPSAEEQSAIATFLDRETARVDALIAEQERLVALLKEKRQALISHAVTKGLDPNVPMKDPGIEWLGQVPAHWDLTPLQRLTDPMRPIMYGIVLPGPDVGEGIPILKGGNVKPSKMNLESMARTTPEIEAPYARARLKSGDLVYAIRGSIGDCEMVPLALHGSNITQDVARIAIRTGVCVRWARWVLLAPAIREELGSGSLGAAVRGVNIFSLKRVKMPTPPYEEQIAIAGFLDIESSKIDSLVEKVMGSITLLKERRAALISAAVTGKIDVRGAAFESPLPSGEAAEGRARSAPARAGEGLELR